MNIFSGSITLKPAKCKDEPFSFQSDGVIYYNGEPCLMKTKTNFFGNVKTVPWSMGEIIPLVEALNHAYKDGYEKDRWHNYE